MDILGWLDDSWGWATIRLVSTGNVRYSHREQGVREVDSGYTESHNVETLIWSGRHT